MGSVAFSNRVYLNAAFATFSKCFKSTRRVAPVMVSALAAIMLLTPSLAAQGMNLVSTMAANEAFAHQHQPLFTYISEERSTRTAGHLWKEKAVETPDGVLRRLLAVDGKPLTPAEQQSEQRRINDLVAHPDDFRKQNQNRKDDEAHATELLQLLPKAFLISPDRERDGCMQFSFRPNPAYEPQTYEERVVHAMAGTVSIKQPLNRLCTLDAHLEGPVEFGFGLLGSITGGHFGLERRQIDANFWKTDRISVHLDGRILFLKSISRNQETVRTAIALVPPHLTLAQAAQVSAQ